MGRINVNGKVINFTSADATNNIIKAENGKYYQKGPKGYREIKQNGQSIFDAAAKKSAEAKKKAQAAANYNKKKGFKPKTKYYVEGNPSYFTMVDKDYNTLYYKDQQRITKEQFLKGANCVYDGKKYVTKNQKKGLPNGAKPVKGSKGTGYYINTKQGKKYYDSYGNEISQYTFTSITDTYIDGDGNIAKYDWWAKTKNAAEGIGNMFDNMFREEVPVYQKDKNGKILLDRNGQPITEKNKDGSPKTDRKFSLSRTCTTIAVGGVIAAVCVLAAPVAAAGAAFLGVGAGTAATIGTIAGVGTQLGIAGYFGFEGYKQMDNADKENENELLSNNERMENWKKKGEGGMQVAMSLMMAKGSVKNAPKTHATARNTAKAIETKNNATLMAKGKVGLRDRISNTRSGFSETVGWKALKKGVGDYHKNNSLKTKAADVVKAPLKLAKETVMEPVRLVTDAAKGGLQLVSGAVKGGAKIITKKGRAKIKGDIKSWRTKRKAQQEANAQFKQNLADMPKENKVQQYESLIEKTTDKNQVAQLLDAIRNDKDLTKAQKAEVATKFFEKNDAQYPGVLDAGKRQKAELGLDKAKTLEDIKQVDREVLPAKKQKVFDMKKTEFEKKEIKKASLDELKQMDREALTEEGKAAFDKRKAKLEKKAQKAENGGSFYDNRVKPAIDGAKAKAKSLFKRKAQSFVEPNLEGLSEQSLGNSNGVQKSAYIKDGKTVYTKEVRTLENGQVETVIKDLDGNIVKTTKTSNTIAQSNKFNVEHKIDCDEYIVDGYKDGGRKAYFDENGHITSSREIIVVDRAKDIALQNMIKEVKAKTSGMSPKRKAAFLQEYVYKKCGKQNVPDGNRKVWSQKNKNKEILLGDIVNENPPVAVCRHRSLLSKILGDEVGLHIELQRGNFADGYVSGGHAWNVVKFEDGTSAIYDAMHNKTSNITKGHVENYAKFYSDVNNGKLYDNGIEGYSQPKSSQQSIHSNPVKSEEKLTQENKQPQKTEPKVSAEFEQEVSSANPTLKTETGKTLQADVVEANVKASVEGLIKKAKNKAELEAINAKLDKMAGDKTITKTAREVILKQKDLVNAAIKKMNRQNTFVGRTITKVKNGFNKVKDAVTSKAKGKIKTEPKYVEPDFKNLTETKTTVEFTGEKITTSVYKNSKGETVYTKEVFDYGDGFPTEVIKDANGREIYSTNTRLIADGEGGWKTGMSETRTTYDANGLKYKQDVTEYNTDGTVFSKCTEKFDQKGNCIESATDNGKYVYKRNEQGQIIKETKTGFDLAKGKKKVTTYEYDAQGNQIRYTETIGNDVAITDIIRKNDGTEHYITSSKGVVERVWETNNGGSTVYYYSKDGKLNMVYGENQIDIKYLEDGKIELTEWVDHKPQTSIISMNGFKAKYGDLVEAPKIETAKPVTEKPVETPKTEKPKTEAQPEAEVKPEVEPEPKTMNSENSFAKFEEMIAKADDLSQVQAKLSNNPEFNKLSNADKLKLLQKLNKRKAELEAAASKSAPKETPKDESNVSKKTGYSDNLFDNVKDMKTPTLGGLSVVKSVDEKLVKQSDNSALDPNQQYAYAEPPVQDDSIVEESSEVDSENEVAEEPPVQESGDQEEVANPEDNGDVENPEESGDADGTNPDDASNNIKDSEDAPASEPEQETQPPATEPQAPAAEQKDGGNAPAPSAPTTPKAPDTPSAQNDSAVKDTIPKSSAPDSNAKGDSSVAPEQSAPAQSDKANDSKKVEDSKNDTVSQVGGEKKNDNVVQENTQEERDIPPVKKAEITKKVQDAKNDDDISAALLELREVGRFKGRKNLRRLLKAKRKYNKELAENDQKKANKYKERIDKYQEKVDENINEINEAYRKKKFEA